MFKIATILAFATCLAACDAFNTMTEGFKHAQAVENDLQISTGMKPQVGFNWRNGQLISVTVTFPGLYERKPLHELAEIARDSVVKNFQQTPGAIVLGFSLKKDGSGGAAS